jgi:hypothetical protein
MDKPLTVDQAKEIAQSFLQAYYQHFDNGARENLQSLYVTNLYNLYNYIVLQLKLCIVFLGTRCRNITINI